MAHQAGVNVARASSRTIGYDIQSPTSREMRLMFELSYVRADKIGGRFITASKQVSLFDKNGRKYERVSDLVVVCVSSGERFHVLGHAEKIRKAV